VSQLHLGRHCRSCCAIGIIDLIGCVLFQEPLEAAREHLAHHAIVIACNGLGFLMLNLRYCAFGEAFGPATIMPPTALRALDVAVVVDLDPARRGVQVEGSATPSSSLAGRRSRPGGGRAPRGHSALRGRRGCASRRVSAPVISTLRAAFVPSASPAVRAIRDVMAQQDQPRDGLSS
jgi:hypothetical protein